MESLYSLLAIADARYPTFSIKSALQHGFLPSGSNPSIQIPRSWIGVIVFCEDESYHDAPFFYVEAAWLPDEWKVLVNGPALRDNERSAAKMVQFKPLNDPNRFSYKMFAKVETGIFT